MVKKYEFVLLLIEPDHIILVQSAPEFIKRSTRAIPQDDGSYEYEENEIAIIAKFFVSETDIGTDGSVFWKPNQVIGRWQEDLNLTEAY